MLKDQATYANKYDGFTWNLNSGAWTPGDSSGEVFFRPSPEQRDNWSRQDGSSVIEDIQRHIDSGKLWFTVGFGYLGGGGGGFLTGPGAVAAVPAGAYAGAAAGGVAGGIIAEIVAKGVLHIIDSGTGSSGCQDDDSMFGSRGTQVTSKTVWQKGGSRIDVENPNPGQRPGQTHFQIRNEKYLYDSAKGNFQNAPNWVNKLLKSQEVQRAISKALKILGEL
jgi:hypothetical protein